VGKKKACGCSVSLITILSIAFIALAVLSVIHGNVGASLSGSQPWSIFAVETPTHELPGAHIFGEHIFITNTMLASWISILVLFGLFFAATRRMKLVPKGLQNVMEFFYETAENFVTDMAGKESTSRLFPICFTIFLIVLANAWIALIPGFETITLNGEPLLRKANTDINVPLSLATVYFVVDIFWAFKVKRAHFLEKFFNFRPLAQGFKKLRESVKGGLGGIGMGVVAVFAGLIELISYFMRVIAFTFRLFGNMTAGVLLTMVIIFIVPMMLPSLSYGLEIFLGFVQAMIFGVLSLAFIMVDTAPEEESA
jgi:F-type H+-transporting ATPase subunit a